MDNFIAVVQTLTHLRTFNLYGALNCKTTAISSTTYKGPTVPDALGPVIGWYEGMTLMDKGFGDGMFVIMPPDEDGWDVIITLKSEARNVFKGSKCNMHSAKTRCLTDGIDTSGSESDSAQVGHVHQGGKISMPK